MTRETPFHAVSHEPPRLPFLVRFQSLILAAAIAMALASAILGVWDWWILRERSQRIEKPHEVFLER